MTTQLEAPPATDPRPRLAPLRAAEIGLAVFGIVAAVLIGLDAQGPVRTIVVLVALMLVPGWTLLRRFAAIEPAARVALTLIGSILFETVVAVGMVWTHFWHPKPAAVAILVIAAVLIARKPAGALAVDSGSGAELDPAPARPASAQGHRLARPVLGAWIALAVAFVLWIVGVSLTNSTDLGQLGLLAAFPAVWYVSVALAFAVVMFGLFTKLRSHGLLAGSIATLIVILYASADVVENAPRLPWVYKHIAVTNYIATHGSVKPSIDIYNRWPGFFSFAASLGTSIGLPNAVDYAAWAEVAFALVDGLLVLAIARSISRHRRWAWTAVIVFTVGNWVGQNYYSPQAFAFMLYLTAALVAVHTLGGEPRRPLRWLENVLATPARRFGRTINGELLGAGRSPRARVLAIVAIIVLQVVITFSHQLTPYVAILALLPLLVFGYLRPLWLALVVVVVPVVYLIPNLGYVETNFGLFSSFDPVANASTASVSTFGVSEAATLQSHGVILLTGVAVVLALAGFVRRILNGHVRTTLVVAWLAFAPVFTFFGQSYGGEGKFRVFLFGLPFYAMGVAWLFWSGKRPAIRMTGLIAALTVLLILFVGTYFQPEASLRISRADVNGALWLDAHFNDDDTVFSVDDTFPLLIGPNYPKQLLRYAQSTAMTDVKNEDPTRVNNKRLEELIAQRYDGGTTWVAFSPNQTHTAIESGTFTRAEITSIESHIAAESTLAYSHDGTEIYALTKK
ncbi:hypothetical protein AX769_20075 [Frondihabitans sp. PAMC 28766]|uniref:hypothetical protein n=1 Tax=Frondihabitans sp. PAMC 28766 TaxID=1795630 RepID=UPI00078C365A|nr:hypothetical protein [Frondihabitans sp. PAMC 28766]AMM22024.1 hypothetical protein AX769_20075 [Frondihabitans sp. PAMC 28766]